MYGENIGERVCLEKTLERIFFEKTRDRVCLEKTLKIERGYVLRKYLREGIFGENI